MSLMSIVNPLSWVCQRPSIDPIGAGRLRSRCQTIPPENEKERPMAITNYSGSVPTFIQLLGGLKGVLTKLEAHATEKKWDQAVVLNTRFYPDMFTLERQVRQACVHAQAAG